LTLPSRHAGLVAFAARENHAVPVGIGLQNGTDRAIELSIHQDDIFAVPEGLKHDVGAKLDRPGDVDEHIDMLRACEQHRILGRDRLQANGGVVEGPL
jgi:hypothetical protein